MLLAIVTSLQVFTCTVVVLLIDYMKQHCSCEITVKISSGGVGGGGVKLDGVYPNSVYPRNYPLNDRRNEKKLSTEYSYAIAIEILFSA